MPAAMNEQQPKKRDFFGKKARPPRQSMKEIDAEASRIAALTPEDLSREFCECATRSLLLAIRLLKDEMVRSRDIKRKVHLATLLLTRLGGSGFSKNLDRLKKTDPSKGRVFDQTYEFGDKKKFG